MCTCDVVGDGVGCPTWYSTLQFPASLSEQAGAWAIIDTDIPCKSRSSEMPTGNWASILPFLQAMRRMHTKPRGRERLLLGTIFTATIVKIFLDAQSRTRRNHPAQSGLRITQMTCGPRCRCATAGPKCPRWEARALGSFVSIGSRACLSAGPLGKKRRRRWWW